MADYKRMGSSESEIACCDVGLMRMVAGMMNEELRGREGVDAEMTVVWKRLGGS
jgi:hypothetical protein